MRHHNILFLAIFLLIGGSSFLAGVSVVMAADDVRTLSLYETHLRETTTITYKRNGKFIPAGMKKMNYALRDWRTGQPTRMNPKLIDTIWELHKELGAKGPVHIVSGYRSPKTNRKLRRRGGGQAKRSQHTLGNAMDVRFPGVSTKKLRAAAMRKERGGVGYYASSRFVHVDVAGVRAWPRMSRYQLAMLFPDKSTRHRPASGGPLTRRDRYKARIRLAKLGVKRGNRSAGRTFLAKNKGKSPANKGQKSRNFASARTQEQRPSRGQLWVNVANHQRFAALDDRIVKANSGVLIAKKKQATPKNSKALKNKIQNILKEYSKVAQTAPKTKNTKLAALTENEADMKDFVARKVGYAPIYSDEDPEEVIYQAFSLSPILGAQDFHLKEPTYNHNIILGKARIVVSGHFRNAQALNPVSRNSSGFKGKAVRNLIGLQAQLNDNTPPDTLKLTARLSIVD